MVAAAVIVGDSLRSAPDRGGSRALASPKSRTFTRPFSVTFTFAGFRSRCTIPFSCAASSPSAIWMNNPTASSTGIGPRRIRSARSSPSTSSITRKCVSPSFSKPCTVAMFGWFSAASAFASRSNRASRSGSAAKSAGSTLIATSRSSFEITRPIHLSHPACTQRVDDLVVAQPGAAWELHRLHSF